MHIRTRTCVSLELAASVAAATALTEELLRWGKRVCHVAVYCSHPCWWMCCRAPGDMSPLHRMPPNPGCGPVGSEGWARVCKCGWVLICWRAQAALCAQQVFCTKWRYQYDVIYASVGRLPRGVSYGLVSLQAFDYWDNTRTGYGSLLPDIIAAVVLTGRSRRTTGPKT